MNLGAANGGQGIRTEDLTVVADLALADLRQKLDQAFAQENIPNTPPVSLSFDAMGGLVVAEHPDKASIEALFAQNADLTNDVRTAYALKENAVTWEKASLYTLAHDRAARDKGASAAEVERLSAETCPSAMNIRNLIQFSTKKSAVDVPA
jgi:hypothetical protein